MMNSNPCLHFFVSVSLSALLWVFAWSAVHAQDTQQSLMPGTYRLDTHETPLYHIPQSQFNPYRQRSVLHIQAIPLQQLTDWGTRLAIVSQDTIVEGAVNSIVFLNEFPDSSVAAGFVSRQTEPIHIQESVGIQQLWPRYGDNPFERAQNGVFNLQGNWFSLYRSPQVETASWKDPLNADKTVWGTVLTIEAAAFNLLTPRDFVDIMYNDGTDSIPLYHQADTGMPPATWFPPNENLFILKDSLNGLWLNVSRFRFVPDQRVRLTSTGRQELRSRLEETTGWVRAEDRYRGQWTAHEEELADYCFEVAGASRVEGDHRDEKGQLSAIKVINKKDGQVSQIISDIGATIGQELSRSLTFVDANFDGHPDIMSDFADGGAGPNYLKLFYLFNPATKRFEYHDDLSGLPQVEVDTEAQVIRSSWRSGAAQHGASVYRFVDGELLQTYQWEQTWESTAGYLAKEVESFLQEDGE